MAYSDDFRWRAVVLLYVYYVALSYVSVVLGISERTFSRWLKRFEETGIVTRSASPQTTARWPPYLLEFVREYIHQNSCFYFEELRHEIEATFPGISNLSDATIC